MNDRQKLVELLKSDLQHFQNDVKYWHDEHIGELADCLIDNGVTVQELDGCEHCRTATYTENPFIVITQMGREVKTQFNFCPNCGRRLPQPPKGE